MPFSAEHLICRYVRTDGQTDELIRVGLGNQRFLQVYYYVSRPRSNFGRPEMHPSRVLTALALGCTARSASQGVCKGIAGGHGCVIIYYGAPAASTAKIRVFDDVHYGKVRYIGVLRTTHYALRPP